MQKQKGIFHMSINSYLSALLCLLLLFSFLSCSRGTNSSDSSQYTSQSTSASQTADYSFITETSENPFETPLTPLTSSQLQEINTFLNNANNRNFIPQDTHDIQYPITVLGGQMDAQNRFLISYVDANLASCPYLLTLKKSDYGYQFISETKIDYKFTNSQYEIALAAYSNDSDNERFIGEIQPETIAVCRMDDGKYYQISLTTTYDAIWVFVSQEELSMSSYWDWVLIGDRESFSIENLGKIEDSNR